MKGKTIFNVMVLDFNLCMYPFIYIDLIDGAI